MKRTNVEVRPEVGETDVNAVQNPLPSFFAFDLNLQEQVVIPPQTVVPPPPSSQVQQSPVPPIQSFSTAASGSTVELPADMTGINDFSSNFSSENSNSSSNVRGMSSSTQRDSPVTGTEGMNASSVALSVDSTNDNTQAVDTPEEERNITARNEGITQDINTQQSWFGTALNRLRDLYNSDYLF